MNVLESSTALKSTLTHISAPLKTALQDIAQNLEIKSDFCIQHPNYQPLEPPTEAVDRFEQLPPDLRTKYLTAQLRGFLYGIYYNGSLKKALARDAQSPKRPLQQDLENSTLMGIDLDFFDRIHQANTGEGYFDPGWQVLKQEDDGSIAVMKSGLTLHIDRDKHLEPTIEAKADDLVAIRLPQNLMQNGFYVAVGNMGQELSLSKNPHSDPSAQTVRVYFSLTPEGAVAAMETLTDCLNTRNIPFSFKVLYNPGDYQRHDSGVLYTGREDYEQVREVLSQVYSTHHHHFHPQEPLFTKRLAPGLSLAEEPNQKFALVESFGQNRCQIIANALLESCQSENDSPENRLSAIERHFQQAGLSLEYPYLNSGNKDIYTSLALS